LLDIEGELVPVPEGDPGDWTLVGTPDSVTAQASKLILVTRSSRFVI